MSSKPAHQKKAALVLSAIFCGLLGGAGFAAAASSEPAASQPGVIWGEDFEGTSYPNPPYWSNLTPFNNYIFAGEGVAGSRAYRARTAKGNANGSPNLEYRFADNPQQGTLYIRVYRRWQSPYEWNSNVNKGFYILGKSGDTTVWRVPFHTQGIGPDYITAKPLVQIYESYTDVGGSGQSYYYQNVNMDKPVVIMTDRWYCMEMMVTPDTQGNASSGAFKVWVDGLLIMDYAGISLRKSATADAQPMNRVELANYFGGGGQQPPFADPNILEEFAFWDQVILSTNYIGPIVDPGPPAAPRGLEIR